jgi:hypothetical protein
MLENADPNIVRPSTRTVDDFLKTHPKKDKIHKFFMEDIDALLKDYAPGDPSMKPDVLAQTKIIEEQRKQMIMAHQQRQQHQQQQQPFLVMEQAGMPPIQMTQQQTIEFINMQHAEILALRQRVTELENTKAQGTAQGTKQGQGSSSTIEFDRPIVSGQRREMQGPVSKSDPEILEPTEFVEEHPKSKSEPEVF